MKIVGTHHMALLTRNFDQLREFYTETLGFPVVGSYPTLRIIFIDTGGMAIELIERADASSSNGGWAHLALEVADVDAAYAELVAKGITFHVPPKNFPDDKSPATRIAFFRDPDGNELQIVQPLGTSRFPNQSSS